MMKSISRKHLIAMLIAMVGVTSAFYFVMAASGSTYSKFYDYLNIYSNEKQVGITDLGTFTLNDKGTVEYNLGLNGEEFTYEVDADRDWNEAIVVKVTTASKTTSYSIKADYVGPGTLKVYNQIKPGTENDATPTKELVAEIVPDADAYAAYKASVEEVSTETTDPVTPNNDLMPVEETPVTTPNNDLVNAEVLYIKGVQPSGNFKISLDLPKGTYTAHKVDIDATIPEYEFSADYSAVSSFNEDIGVLIGETAPLVYVFENSVLTDQLFVAQNKVIWLNSKTIKVSHSFNGITYSKYITIPADHVPTTDSSNTVVSGYDYGDAPIKYKSAGTYVDYNQVYQLSNNNNNSKSNVVIDTESSFNPTTNALGDDTTGVDDDESISGSANKTDIYANVTDGYFTINLGYKIEGEAELGVWIDSNENSVFDKTEGYIYSLNSGYGEQQYKSLTFPLKGTSLTAGDSVYIRARIVQGTGMKTTDGDKDISRVGETEDYKITLYEQNQSEVSQVCNATYTESNIMNIKSVNVIDDGYVFTMDIGSFQDAQLTVAGDGVISIKSMNPLQFDFQPNSKGTKQLGVYLRDSAGNPMHLPLQWNMSFLYGSSDITMNKNMLYQKRLTSADIAKDASSRIYIIDQTTNWKISGTTYTDDIRKSSLFISNDTVSGSDMTFTQNGKVRYTLTLNTAKIKEATIPCNDKITVDDSGMKAYVQKYSSKYYDAVGLYSKAPFKYVITNIPVPTNTTDFTSIKHTFTMPNNVGFDSSDTIKVYSRKAGTGNNYIQMGSGYTTSYSSGVSTVNITSWTAGYEYRIVYPLKAGANFNKNVTQYLNSKVTYVYKKTTVDSALNQIVLNGLQSFKLRFDMTMGENVINVESTDPEMDVEDYGLYYSAKKNCGNCTFSKKLPLTSEGISFEAVDDSEAGTFEDNRTYKVEIYDDKFKVAQFNVQQWKPTMYEGDSLEEINENVNPIQDIVYYEKGYTDETVQSEYFVGEKFIPVSYDLEQQEAGKVEVKLAYNVVNTLTSVPSSWSGIKLSSIEAGDPSELGKYYSTAKQVDLFIPEDYVDVTLETPITTIDGENYKEMTYTLTKYYNNNTEAGPQLTPNDSYYIEEFSGRMYNRDYGTLYNPTTDPAKIAQGQNDAYDDDLKVSDYVSNQFLISQSAPSTDFTFYESIEDFGLNRVSYMHEFEATDQYKMFGYFENESSYYVKPGELTAEETQCIKNNVCPSSMTKIDSGTVTNAKGIKSEIDETPGKIKSAKTLNSWIDKYIN